MIITKTVYISPAGGLRIAPKNGRPMKGEITASLVLDVPDSAFAPPALTLRATVAGASPSKAIPALPTSITEKNGHHPSDDGDGEIWTSVRIRRVMALLGIDAEAMAARIGVSLSLVRGWERASGALNINAATRTKLGALEAEASGVTA